MSRNIDHVLLTRFNIPSPGVESLVRAKEGWLRNRLALFEEYCLPAVRAQTNTNFRWIIYLDPESPEWLTSRLNELNVPEVFVPIYRTAISDADRISDIRTVTGATGDILITTNLDNDDGLASDFVDRLQTLPSGAAREAVYLVNGLIRHGESLYARRDPSNAFCSVRETWDNPVTCWADWHNRLGRSMPVREVEGGPGWLQLIHDTNVSNRIRGRRIARGPHAQTFGPLLAGVKDPDAAERLFESTLSRPYRVSRDAVRNLAKEAVLRTIGKSGLNQLKSFVQARVSPLAKR